MVVWNSRSKLARKWSRSVMTAGLMGVSGKNRVRRDAPAGTSRAPAGCAGNRSAKLRELLEDAGPALRVGLTLRGRGEALVHEHEPGAGAFTVELQRHARSLRVT